MKSKKTLIVVVSIVVLLGVAGFLFLYKILMVELMKFSNQRSTLVSWYN
jgi:hypothetical protein